MSETALIYLVKHSILWPTKCNLLANLKQIIAIVLLLLFMRKEMLTLTNRKCSLWVPYRIAVISLIRQFHTAVSLCLFFGFVRVQSANT